MTAQLEAAPLVPNPFMLMTDDVLLARWRKFATDADVATATADRLWAEVERRIALEKSGAPLGI